MAKNALDTVLQSALDQATIREVGQDLKGSLFWDSKTYLPTFFFSNLNRFKSKQVTFLAPSSGLVFFEGSSWV